MLGPLNLADTGRALGLEAIEAVDAHLICGGLPGILRSWPSGADPMSFLEQECADPAAPVFSVPESALLAEFPAPDQARRFLESLGAATGATATSQLQRRAVRVLSPTSEVGSAHHGGGRHCRSRLPELARRRKEDCRSCQSVMRSSVSSPGDPSATTRPARTTTTRSAASRT